MRIMRVGASNKPWDWKYLMATLLNAYAGSPRSNHLRYVAARRATSGSCLRANKMDSDRIHIALIGLDVAISFCTNAHFVCEAYEE